MTIAYPNGAVLKAFVLSHDDHEIRAIAAGYGDVLTFSCIQGTWISEGLERVSIEFEWQSRGATTTTSEDGTVCPKAARMLRILFGGGEFDATIGETLDVFRPEGSFVAPLWTRQQPN